MTNQPETTKLRNASFGEWLKGFITFKISNNSKREIKLFPRWLMIGVLALNNAFKGIGIQSNYWIFMDFVIGFLFCSFIWYGIIRLIGKAKI